MSDTPVVELRQVSKTFDDVKAVDNVTLQIPTGGIVALLGPSGCGKTTTLRLIHRLEEATSGQLLARGQDVRNQPPARAVAQETGVDEVHAELLPADKVAAVEALVSRYGSVAMVGADVNDAPALGRATVGIALGAAGSDAAIETVDIALMSDDLTRLPWLIHHSRRTLTIIRQNIGFSLAVKALFVLLTFVGFAALWAAIAADMGASLLVICNGLRLLRQP